MSEEMQERIHDELEYSDSKSEWVRHAIELRFAVDEELGAVEDEADYPDRIDEVVDAIGD